MKWSDTRKTKHTFSTFFIAIIGVIDFGSLSQALEIDLSLFLRDALTSENISSTRITTCIRLYSLRLCNEASTFDTKNSTCLNRALERKVTSVKNEEADKQQLILMVNDVRNRSNVCHRFHNSLTSLDCLANVTVDMANIMTAIATNLSQTADIILKSHLKIDDDQRNCSNIEYKMYTEKTESDIKKFGHCLHGTKETTITTTPTPKTTTRLWPWLTTQRTTTRRTTTTTTTQRPYREPTRRRQRQRRRRQKRKRSCNDDDDGWVDFVAEAIDFVADATIGVRFFGDDDDDDDC